MYTCILLNSSVVSLPRLLLPQKLPGDDLSGKIPLQESVSTKGLASDASSWRRNSACGQLS